MAEAVEEGDVDVVDLADLPYAPVLTASAVKLALGLFLGLLLGLMLAYLLEALNTSIRRPGGPRGGAAPAGFGGHSRASRAARPMAVAGCAGCSAAASRGRTPGSPMSGDADLLDRHRGLPEPSHQPHLVGRRRGTQDAGGHQRHAGRGQDADRGQPRRHPGLRRTAGAAGRLRHPPASGARHVPRAARAGAHGDAHHHAPSRAARPRRPSGRRPSPASSC